MKTKFLSEEEIDRIVVAQADDDSAWGKPRQVKRVDISTTHRRKRRGSVEALKKQRNGRRQEKF